MRTVLSLERRFPRDLPPELSSDEVRFPEALVEHVLGRFTRAGQRVLDPFAGFGTTLEVAERMGRDAFGVELDSARVAFARSHLSSPERLIHGDARKLAELGLKDVDLVMTSPPYRPRSNHPEDPLTAYRDDGVGYSGYLRGLRDVFVQVRDALAPSAFVTLEVSNIKTNHEVTPLAWDVAAELSSLFRFAGEIVVVWDEPSFGYDHTYCLVFEHSLREG